MSTEAESPLTRIWARAGEAWRWNTYYQVRRRLQRVPILVARRLPRWLKYWVLIDIGARYTGSEWFDGHPMQARLGEMLDWEHNARGQKMHT